MRLGNNKKRDYSRVLERSMAKDFASGQPDRQKPKTPQNAEKQQSRQHQRISQLGERCEYREFARFLLGKAVELVEPHSNGGTTGWYRFVFDDDRLALNKAAGWSNAKEKYLLTAPKFK